MTVRIIRHGSLPEERTYKATCNYCLTQFQFHRKDAEFHDDPREGSWLEIKCPFAGCNSTVQVYAE